MTLSVSPSCTIAISTLLDFFVDRPSSVCIVELPVPVHVPDHAAGFAGHRHRRRWWHGLGARTAGEAPALGTVETSLDEVRVLDGALRLEQWLLAVRLNPRSA